MTTLDQAIGQMAAAGLPPLPSGHPVTDGRIHRFGPRRKAWYVLHEYLARNGQRFIFGAFGIWQGAENNAIKVEADLGTIDADERQRLQRAQAAQEHREREKRDKLTRFAAGRALQQWNTARADGWSPYLERKGFQRGAKSAKGLRYFNDGTLVVPMVRYDVAEERERDPQYTGPRRLAGLQKIAPDGTKLFNRGMAKIGVACRLGAKPKDGETILIGEGVATVLTALEALDCAFTAFVAFDAGNLAPVAHVVRGLYPKSPILFLADDDAYLEAQFNKRLRDDYGVAELYQAEQGERSFGAVKVRADLFEAEGGVPALTGGVWVDEKLRTVILVNTGRTKAQVAATAVRNAWVCWPKFAKRVLGPDPEAPRFTDFNDLHQAEGLEAVCTQLGAELEQVHSAVELARALAEGRTPDAAGVAGVPGGSSGASGGAGKGGDGVDWRLHGRMLRRFSLVYPSDTAFDDELGRIVRIGHMRHLLGGREVERWLHSPRRRVILPEQIVFDPTGKTEGENTVNLFRGLEMKPSATASCDLTIQLAHYLCGEEEATEAPITTWMLRWLAYQVQHLGAKMQTAIVMFGPEGTGKNLFWGMARQIFGRYGALITQSELEDKHNTWLSAKLFLIANEVVTRAEMAHHVGRLKNLITEDEVYINPKGIDQRYEKNHVNIVFCSNELQPLKISPGDRRYMVIRTPAVKPESFYAAVGEELRRGGAQAFYRYLLDLDLADFSPHTKPLVTQAKEDLIEIGLMASQLFWRDLHDGILGLPYQPALVTDVYRAYLIWCARNGERVPERINRFIPSFMSLNGVRRGEFRMADPDNPVLGPVLAMDNDADSAGDDDARRRAVRRRRVLLMGEGDRDPSVERMRIATGIAEFRSALRAWSRDGRGASGDAAWQQEPAF